MARSRGTAAMVIPESRRWTEDEARAVLAAAEDSGVTLREFALVHGLTLQRLERWRRQLHAPRAQGAVFQEITPARTEGDVDVIEVVLLNGRVLRVGPDFSEAALRRLLAVVDEDAC